MSSRIVLLFTLLGGVLFWSSCNKDGEEEVEVDTEVITEVTLLFSPFEGGAPISFTATDPDGEGPEELTPEEPIVLNPSTTYDLFIQLENEAVDVADEIEEEGDQHMFFFAISGSLFNTPIGNGNIDERTEDAVLYRDEDINGLPIGLITTWVTASGGSFGTFRVLLKHQEDGLKSAVSTAEDGATDLDITWDLTLAQ